MIYCPTCPKCGEGNILLGPINTLLSDVVKNFSLLPVYCSHCQWIGELRQISYKAL